MMMMMVQKEEQRRNWSTFLLFGVVFVFYETMLLFSIILFVHFVVF